MDRTAPAQTAYDLMDGDMYVGSIERVSARTKTRWYATDAEGSDEFKTAREAREWLEDRRYQGTAHGRAMGYADLWDRYEA